MPTPHENQSNGISHPTATFRFKTHARVSAASEKDMENAFQAEPEYDYVRVAFSPAVVHWAIVITSSDPVKLSRIIESVIVCVEVERWSAAMTFDGINEPTPKRHDEFERIIMSGKDGWKLDYDSDAVDCLPTPMDVELDFRTKTILI